MAQPTPKELIQDKLYELEKALQKSFESYRRGEISKELYNTHKENNTPLIFQYKQALNLLKSFN